MTCLYGLKKPWKWSKRFLVLFLKYGRKIPVKSRRISKVSLHFKKMANSSITVLQKYSEICIFCVTQCTGFQKQSVGGVLKNFGKYLKTVSNEVHFMVNLYSFPYRQSPGQTLFPSGKSFLPLPRSQNSPLLGTSTIALVCIFFSILSYFKSWSCFVNIKTI